MEKLYKTSDRINEFGEVFTPDWMVQKMCDEVPGISDPNKTVLEPSCGNGNFLVEIVNRRLKSVVSAYNESSIESLKYYFLIVAIAKVYGVDIQLDNVKESRRRIIEAVKKCAETELSYKLSKEEEKSIEYLVECNIIYGDTLKALQFTDSGA